MRLWILLIALLMIAPTGLRAETLEVDLSEACRTQMETTFQGLDCSTIPPYEIEKADPPGGRSHWKIRFHFGFSRTQYSNSDMAIRTPTMNVVVRDFSMVERTSSDFYNPRTWQHPLDALRWIDEPSNTFTLSFEKGANVIYITVFHPKYLQSFDYTPADPDGSSAPVIHAVGNENPPVPAGASRIDFLNTYQSMVWQVGYGRKFELFQSKRSGHLSYIPKADIGFSTGRSRTSITGPDGEVKTYDGGSGYQGMNASIGHRLEYNQGKMSVFVDQKMIFSHREHEFLDGTATYNLRMTPITIGIGVDLFARRSRHERFQNE